MSEVGKFTFTKYEDLSFVDRLADDSFFYTKKQDEVIRKMAEFISKFDIDESICKKVKNCNHEDSKSCIDCIVKFFKKG